MPNSYVGTVLLDFPVDSRYCDDAALDELETTIKQGLEQYFGQFTKLYSGPLPPSNGWIILLHSNLNPSTTATIKTYPSRNHVTVTLEYDLKEFSKVPMGYEQVSKLELSLASMFQGHKKTGPIPPIKRALDFDIYFTTSDSRLLEYDVQELLFDDTSEFQHVQIAKSINYGNFLILDGLVNMAEADIAYTETLMCRGKVEYEGKDVLILGGGDGALLYELRKEGTNSITMIEIDDMVMEACRKYLRGACYDSLDKYKNENYEIVIGDCIPYMKRCEQEGRQFDYVFGDLTDIPISLDQGDQIWDFFRKSLRLSFSILKQGGVFFTHANGITSGESLKMFEQVITETLLHCQIQFQQSQAFIPSFKEKWVFYQIKKV